MVVLIFFLPRMFNLQQNPLHLKLKTIMHKPYR